MNEGREGSKTVEILFFGLFFWKNGRKWMNYGDFGVFLAIFGIFWVWCCHSCCFC